MKWWMAYVTAFEALRRHVLRSVLTMLGVSIGVGADYIVLCPVAVGLHRGRVKAWDGFGRLCDELRAQGHAVVACPAPGEREAVNAALRGAVAAVLKAGKPRTPDLGGNAKTVEVTDAVLAAIG